MKFVLKQLLIVLTAFLLTTVFLRCVSADVFVVTKTAIWQVSDAGAVKIGSKQAGDKIVLDAGVEGPTDPTDPPDPGPSDPLEKMVLDAATLIDEPGVAMVVGAGYQTAADGMGGGKDWDTMISFTSSFRGIAISRSNKKAQWLEMFTVMDIEISKRPKTGATLQSVADGFTGAAEAGGNFEKIEWQKFIECLPCIFNAFLSEEEAIDPKPDPTGHVDVPTFSVLKTTPKLDLYAPMYSKTPAERAIINRRHK